MKNVQAEQIDKLCRKFTDLDSADIARVKELAVSLPIIADLEDADVFIDCPTKDPEVAVVIAQAAPASGKSLYSGSVVGEYAKKNNEPAVFRTLTAGLPTKDLLGRTQENREVLQKVSPIRNSVGKVIACLICEMDISKDMQTKRNLSLLTRATSQLTDALLLARNKDEGIPFHVTDGIVIFDRRGIAVYANPVAKKIYKDLGFINELEGLSFENLCFEERNFDEILEDGKIISSEVRFGQQIFNAKYLVMEGKVNKNARIGMLLTDETDVKTKEKELILKSVAIKEIHHRVKNNLQTIASLLRLQSRRINSKMAKKAFSDSIARVLSIAATHEVLAQNGVDDIELNMMLKKIVQSANFDSSESGKDITITIEGDSIRQRSEMATSIALVVNELVQNSIKHAFTGRREGKVDIMLRKGKVFSCITITDNGIGFEMAQMERASSLGMQIVQQLVRGSLGGSLNIETSEKGTTVVFDFFCTPQGEKMH